MPPKGPTIVRLLHHRCMSPLLSLHAMLLISDVLNSDTLWVLLLHLLWEPETRLQLLLLQREPALRRYKHQQGVDEALTERVRKTLTLLSRESSHRQVCNSSAADSFTRGHQLGFF